MSQGTAQSELDTDLKFGPSGLARVAFRDRLAVQTAVTCWNYLEERLRGAKLEVDASGRQSCDGAGLALLRYLSLGQMTPQAAVSVHGLEAGLEQVFRAFTLQDYETYRLRAQVEWHPVPEEVGYAVRQAASDFCQQVEFPGSVTGNLLPTLLDRKRMRWLELEPAAGKFFVLSTGSLSALGYENNLPQPVVRLWNDTHHLDEEPIQK